MKQGENPTTEKLDNSVEPTRAAFVKWKKINPQSGEVEAWEANNAQIFNHLLLHCSPEFRSKLRMISHQKDRSK